MGRRIIINAEEIDEVAAKFGRGLARDELQRLMRRVLRNEERLFSTVTELPPDPPPWLTQDMIASGHVCRFDWQRVELADDLRGKVRLVELWLASSRWQLVHETEPAQRKWRIRLRHIQTLAEAIALAVRESEEWRHLREARQERRRNAGRFPEYELSDSLAATLEAAEEMKRIIVCADGRVWFELVSDRAKWHEGVLMGHCLRKRYRFELEKEGARVFSLRADCVQEQVTLAVWPDEHWQAVRRGNEAISAADELQIKDLLKHLGLGEGRNIGSGLIHFLLDLARLEQQGRAADYDGQMR